MERKVVHTRHVLAVKDLAVEAKHGEVEGINPVNSLKWCLLAL